MPAYTDEALDSAGKAQTGVLEAENAKAARSQLRAQGLVPLSVAALAASVQSAGASRWARRAFSSSTLAVWTRQLAGMVGAGQPLAVRPVGKVSELCVGCTLQICSVLADNTAPSVSPMPFGPSVTGFMNSRCPHISRFLAR